MPRVKLFDEKEVLNKAMCLFWRQGYAATSMQDLVNHMGISRASLYDTYGNKEKLFNQAFEQYRKSGAEGIKTFFQNHSEVKEGFRKLFELAINEAINDKEKKGCFVINTTTELIPNDLGLIHVLKENKATFEQLFFDYLSLGVKKGQIATNKDLKAICSLFYIYYNGLKVVTKVDASKVKLDNSIDVFLSILD
jgi:TetR/AcrR family transcriptional repressor of nem operon